MYCPTKAQLKTNPVRTKMVSLEMVAFWAQKMYPLFNFDERNVVEGLKFAVVERF